MIPILDTEINLKHSAFQDLYTDGNPTPKVLSYPKSKKFVSGDSEDEEDFTDNDGHGTHCAGIAAGCQYTAMPINYANQAIKLPPQKE